MSKTISYYNICLLKDGEKTAANFLDFIDRIAQIDWGNRVRKVEDSITAFFPMDFSSDPGKRIIPFGKFRMDYKPFIGDVTTSEIEEIRNDVVELVTMVYDQRFNTAVIDYNHYGLKQKDIENYLNTFLPNHGDTDWEVKLIPIKSKNSIEDVKASKQIKYFILKIKLDDYTSDWINERTSEETNLILNLLSSLSEATKDLEANVFDLKVSVGREKTTLSLEAIKQLLKTLNIDDSSIKSIKVRYRDQETEELDILDLKEINKDLKDKIFQNKSNANPTPEYVGNEIIENYNNHTSTIHENHLEFREDLVEVEFPEIREEPGEDYSLHNIDD
ncbi:DUF6731 family protein [Halanaerobium congolense]|uniref:Uncharacterized protein n=1 Tax=Halanaerobium congolense TaxID=54121 RepID=A0A1G6MR73_9FIRM|nr:DUF6731 family protein [Halanaerobium congolense]SDC57486.1 hypothetical protein SAMN04488597_10928 [Halanaerobium congolense]